MIVVDKKKRHPSSIVRRELLTMFQECKKDQNYALANTKPEEKALEKVRMRARKVLKLQVDQPSEEDRGHSEVPQIRERLSFWKRLFTSKEES